MKRKTIALVGVNGLVGNEAYEYAVRHNEVGMLNLLVRSPFEKKYPNTSVKLVNFFDTESIGLALEGCEGVMIAIGTTRNKVQGNLDKYREIDRDIPRRIATMAKLAGLTCLGLVSAIGADATANNFYNKIKGEAEEAVIASGIPSVHIFQPSLLMGNRKEFRLGERIAQAVAPVVKPFIPDRLKPIAASVVGAAMVQAVLHARPGVNRYTYKGIMELLKTR